LNEKQYINYIKNKEKETERKKKKKKRGNKIRGP
jgi:hypothetical protein